MNLKVFIRLVLLLVVVFSLIAGVVAGGIALSYRIANYDDDSELEWGTAESTDPNKGNNKEIEQKKPNILNVLLLGVDAEGYRTDVIILAQYNEDTKKVNMLQVPRDTKIETFRSDKKINSAYAFGKEQELFTAVKNLTGIEVEKYVLVNLKGFRTLIDEIGGVTVNVPINMNYDDPIQNLYIHLNKGTQALNGKKAEMFVRFRKNNDGTGYPEGDVGRVKAQQEFISAVIDKTVSIKNIFKIPKLVAIVIQNVKTNFETQEMYKYVDDALQINKERITMMTLPGEGEFIGGISYFIHDKAKTAEMIKEYFTPEENINESIEKTDLGNNNQQEDEQQESLPQEEEKQAEYKPSWKNKFIKVEVLNGSNTDGVATMVAEDLKAKGFNVIRVDNFKGVRYSKTVAIDRTSRQYSREIIKALGEIDTSKDLDKSVGVDVTVIVGNDMIEVR
ncbi:LCP family protein [Petroclostridium sp. X23]|uniref:LCP family protein n=1 Tax=Petroclostridium sp. X23 TaxID=3045146 RepID=UPI0024AD12EE|nr:LCP family protein [Petroclostridium sp. X23]WHH58422.1 LCP family protein [Petroclostridium sp. X23]